MGEEEKKKYEEGVVGRDRGNAEGASWFQTRSLCLAADVEADGDSMEKRRATSFPTTSLLSKGARLSHRGLKPL